jgi:hypothetical protein
VLLLLAARRADLQRGIGDPDDGGVAVHRRVHNADPNAVFCDNRVSNPSTVDSLSMHLSSKWSSTLAHVPTRHPPGATRCAD